MEGNEAEEGFEKLLEDRRPFKGGLKCFVVVRLMMILMVRLVLVVVLDEKTRFLSTVWRMLLLMMKIEVW